jgi:hypothetical protein
MQDLQDAKTCEDDRFSNDVSVKGFIFSDTSGQIGVVAL